ncbi:TonB family protein [Thiobacillus sp.]|uniref:energy transducer TonB n=1 Tax=Thiobacillus sp. TaxID=924 RepID=UPI00286E507B|nr:TonB family protein [Thiobacillus sp.]
MNMPFEEPTLPPISPRAQRVLVAGWISLGLHAALIALVQVAPPAPVSLGETVIEARLVSRQAASVAAVQPPATGANPPEVPTETPRLVPSEAVDMLPVARPQVAPPPDVPPAPAPAPADPVASAEPAVAVPPPAPAPATAITSAVDLTYYSARDVDVHPRALHEVIPVYPADADRRRVSGKLRLQLKLQADGRVSDLEVLSASPPGVFDESALQAFRTARFAPAQKNGRPVRALVQIEVVYDWAGQDRR